VPTAVVAWTPKINTSKGVISEPPPTPVNPTRTPIKKPESAKEGLIAWRMSIVSVPLRPKFVRYRVYGRIQGIGQADGIQRAIWTAPTSVFGPSKTGVFAYLGRRPRC